MYLKLYGDEPQVRIHEVLGSENGNAIGGDLLQAKVHPTVEVILKELPSYLEKWIDK